MELFGPLGSRFPAVYTIRFIRRFSSHLEVAFVGMELTTDGDMTVMTGPVVDQAHLHGIIQQLGTLGLELVDVHRHGLPKP
jgi:hypothetical protein